jgi:hypothetical protein
MKKLFLLILLTLSAVTISAQKFSNLKSISLEDSLECKQAEPKVLECANYLLSRPLVEDLNSLTAIQFIMRWMEETSDYTFSIDKTTMDMVKSDQMLFGMYLACQAKAAITAGNRNFKSDGIILFLEYCENSKNKVKASSTIKKLIKAKNNGTLNEALSL